MTCRLLNTCRRLPRCDWASIARPEQLPPPGDWSIWVISAGRGFGKTRSGAEWVRSIAEAASVGRIALVGPKPGSSSCTTWSAAVQTPINSSAMDGLLSNIDRIVEYRALLSARILHLLVSFDSEATLEDVKQLILEHDAPERMLCRSDRAFPRWRRRSRFLAAGDPRRLELFSAPLPRWPLPGRGHGRPRAAVPRSPPEDDKILTWRRRDCLMGRRRNRFLRCRGTTLATGARVDEASWKPCCTEPRAAPPHYGDLGASDAVLLGAC